MVQEIRNLREALGEDADRRSDQGRTESDALPGYESQLISIARRASREPDMASAIRNRQYSRVMDLLSEIETAVLGGVIAA